MARVESVQESLEQLPQDQDERLRLIVESTVDYSVLMLDPLGRVLN